MIAGGFRCQGRCYEENWGFTTVGVVNRGRCCCRELDVSQGPSACVWDMWTNDGVDDAVHARSMTLKSHHVWRAPDTETERKDNCSDGRTFTK